jgi:hypothetical protein
MANFGWAYINCSGATDGASAGPDYSLQFVTGAVGGHTTGSAYLTFYTGSTYSYAANTLVLTGTLLVTGTISASHYHIEDVAIIDATGSTYFGNTNDDTHLRTGSLLIATAAPDASTEGTLVLSASATTERVYVRGFGGRYKSVTGASYTVKDYDYIIGCSGSADQTLYLPSASTVGAGVLMVVKDEYNNRSATSVYVSASLPAGGFTIEDQAYYQLNGTMAAINLYSDGTNWFVF